MLKTKILLVPYIEFKGPTNPHCEEYQALYS